MQKQMRCLGFLTKTRLGKIALLSTVLLISIIFSSIAFVNASSLIPYVELEHSIQVTRGGLIIVNETINLHNNSTEPITSFLIGFHKSFVKNLDDATAFTSLGERLTMRKGDVDNDTNIYWMNISFPEAIGRNEGYDFSVAFAFSKLITYSKLEPTVYTAFFPKYPALAIEAASCMVEISLPSGTTFVESSWGNSTTYLKSPLEENSNQTGSVSFKGALQYVECSFAKREVVIDSWGKILSLDTYKIRNLGKEDVRGLDFPLPSDAEEMIAYDDFGSLTTSVRELSGKKSVYVTFRYPLRGEANSIPYHDSYSFTIQYNLKTQEHLTQTTPLSSYRFEIDVFPCPDWTMESLETKVTFPEGANNIQASPAPARTSQNLFTQSITYTTKDLTPLHKPYLTINYEYNIFWSAFRPLLWVGIVTIVVGGITFLRKGKKPKPPPMPSKEVELIRTFIEACGERIGLWIEFETLENDFDNRRIRRKAFNRRRRIFVQRLSSLNKEVANLENGVRRMGARYAELIEKVEKAEVEVRTLRSEVNRLRNQLRRGKLSKNAYRKLREAYDKRIQKAKAVIEDVIIELKSIVG